MTSPNEAPARCIRDSATCFPQTPSDGGLSYRARLDSAIRAAFDAWVKDGMSGYLPNMLSARIAAIRADAPCRYCNDEGVVHTHEGDIIGPCTSCGGLDELIQAVATAARSDNMAEQELAADDLHEYIASIRERRLAVEPVQCPDCDDPAEHHAQPHFCAYCLADRVTENLIMRGFSFDWGDGTDSADPADWINAMVEQALCLIADGEYRVSDAMLTSIEPVPAADAVPTKQGDV